MDPKGEVYREEEGGQDRGRGGGGVGGRKEGSRQLGR